MLSFVVPIPIFLAFAEQSRNMQLSLRYTAVCAPLHTSSCFHIYSAFTSLYNKAEGGGMPRVWSYATVMIIIASGAVA